MTRRNLIGGSILLGSGLIIVGVALLVALFTGRIVPSSPVVEPASSKHDELPQVVAIVNGEAITRDMVEAELKISRLNIIEPLPALTGEDLERAIEEAANQLITRHLILQAAVRDNVVLTDDFVESRADSLFGSSGPEALAEALRQAGATREALLWWVREIMTVEAYVTEVIMANAAPEARQDVYNDWLNARRAAADIKTYLNGEEQRLPALINEPAPDFTLTNLAGQEVTLSDYAGQVVLVNFWASWCPSCITEMPAYEQVYQQYGHGEGEFVVLGVNLQEGQAHVEQYANGLGLTFPVLLDQNGNVTNHHYQVTGMPASIIIDRQGVIFYRHLGPMSDETLVSKLEELGL